MARSAKRVPDPSNPILNSPDNLPAQHSDQKPVDVAGDRADELAFMRAQYSAMMRFWKETENDDL